MKKLSLKFVHKLKKLKFEKSAPSSTAEFHQISETFIKFLFSFILKKKSHPQLRYMEGYFNKKSHILKSFPTLKRIYLAYYSRYSNENTTKWNLVQFPFQRCILSWPCKPYKWPKCSFEKNLPRKKVWTPLISKQSWNIH